MHTGPGMAHAQQSAGRVRERNAEAEFRWAKDIIACSPMSIRALVRSDDLDMREGPLAFAQKRALLWKGR
jgi:hypothetical protein